ncbi:hypothetical protein E2C01_081544 [Portunus trituberculatus]|uniref:Uncharacterized protein n=1 Tax=Portunus trituberculatus TaxID=210409 RepID=A0A5B7IZ49_PORTR|nr:hypothetical protein [Portunus trituberculatus]
MSRPGYGDEAWEKNRRAEMGRDEMGMSTGSVRLPSITCELIGFAPSDPVGPDASRQQRRVLGSTPLR